LGGKIGSSDEKKAVAIYAFIEAAKLVTNQGMEKSLWQP
jgi:hypothetical protein